nr:glycosyltransferase [Bacteroidota bacterium]
MGLVDKRSIKRQYHKISFMLSFIQDLGGFKVFIKKAFGVLSSNGLPGVISKIKHIIFHARKEGFASINRHDYNKWIRLYTELSIEEIQKMKAAIEKFEHRPEISVIMPTFNGNPTWLKEAIESIQNQIYPNWELCIADDASTDATFISLLKQFQEQDQRIKVVFRDENGHISLASNDAINMASGAWLALFDHDDLLSKDALFWVVNAINQHPDACLIYSDEDKINRQGKRSDPYFKCDWNYDLFLSQNIVSHLGIYKTELVRRVGGFRQQFEGSQDYDLALRIIEYVKPEQIIHIPLVLYHWRTHQQSTSIGSEKKPYAVIAAQKAISEHLQRRKIDADIEILPLQMYRVKYKLPHPYPLVSIIIPTKNNKTLLEQCINSITKKTDYPNYEILVVDNNSND